VEGLLQRHVEMAAEITNLDSDLQMLVYENYSKFISATDTIRRSWILLTDIFCFYLCFCCNFNCKMDDEFLCNFMKATYLDYFPFINRHVIKVIKFKRNFILGTFALWSFHSRSTCSFPAFLLLAKWYPP
jgi:hypothetical protein